MSPKSFNICWEYSETSRIDWTDVLTALPPSFATLFRLPDISCDFFVTWRCFSMFRTISSIELAPSSTELACRDIVFHDTVDVPPPSLRASRSIPRSEEEFSVCWSIFVMLLLISPMFFSILFSPGRPNVPR